MKNLLFGLLLFSVTANANIKTITHPKDNHWQISRQDLRDIFTLYQMKWSDGSDIKVGMHPWHSVVHREFVRNELNGSPIVLRALVESRINRGQASHVTTVYSTKEAISFVVNNVGAISYGEDFLVIGERDNVQVVTIVD